MNLAPLCTAMVRFTMSGTTVERRDQVLITRLSPREREASTLVCRCSSTKGPLCTERGMAGSWFLLLVPAADDHLVRALVVAGLVALGRHAPRRRRMAAAGGAPLAAAHRVVDRVHRHAAVVRAAAQPALAPRLAEGDVLVIEVADLADRGVALDVHPPHLARGQLDLRPAAVARHQLRAGAGAAHHLAALAELELDVVDHRAERDEAQRQGVADVDLGLLARHHLRPDRQAVGPDDVALLAVGGMQQG